MSNNDGAAVAISMSVGEELSRLMVQADHLREENERLREALRKIQDYDGHCNVIYDADDAIGMMEIARAALGEKE